MIATKANVKKLLIGHYSSRYKDVTPLLAEARGVFKNTLLAIEGEEQEQRPFKPWALGSSPRPIT